MVSKWWIRSAQRNQGKTHHQSKIYTESNQSVFLQIFVPLSSMQTLAIYRWLLVRNRLRDQPQRLRAPSQKPAISIAEFRDVSQRKPKETTGVARCFFCFAWRSGSGWCSCCCRESIRRRPPSCRRSGHRKRCRPPANALSAPAPPPPPARTPSKSAQPTSELP